LSSVPAIVDDALFVVRNKKTGKVLDIEGGIQNLIQNSFNGGDNQLWKFKIIKTYEKKERFYDNAFGTEFSTEKVFKFFDSMLADHYQKIDLKFSEDIENIIVQNKDGAMHEKKVLSVADFIQQRPQLLFKESNDWYLFGRLLHHFNFERLKDLLLDVQDKFCDTSSFIWSVKSNKEFLVKLFYRHKILNDLGRGTIVYSTKADLEAILKYLVEELTNDGYTFWFDKVDKPKFKTFKMFIYDSKITFLGKVLTFELQFSDWQSYFFIKGTDNHMQYEVVRIKDYEDTIQFYQNLNALHILEKSHSYLKDINVDVVSICDRLVVGSFATEEGASTKKKIETQRYWRFVLGQRERVVPFERQSLHE